MPGLSKKEKRLAKRAAEPVEPEIRLPRFDWWAWARRIVGHPATSYVAILLFQLKMIWGIWWYKDMTTGDTSDYFSAGARWFREGVISFVWSPLYCSFLGELLHISSDAYTIVILHRVLIILALALIVLALMRRLLPPFIAWIAAAWWAALPIDFNALYEVHLFAVIPLVLAVLVILWKPGPWGRGSAIAILVGDGLLIRNENLAAAGLLAVLSLGYEFWKSRRSFDDRPALISVLWAYGVPILCTILVASFFFVHRLSYDSWALVKGKHDVNVCQVFAAGYQQRTHDFGQNAMDDCGQLMQRTFGSSNISMMDALRANPPAILGHFWWNIRLLPSGLEVLMFNYRAGDANPDYAETYRSNLVLIPSLAACAVVALGAYFFFSERKQWIERWSIEYAPFWGSVLEARIWAWITLGCLSLVVCGAILTNRPRPSYMFILGIALRALIGLCLFIVIRRWPKSGAVAVAMAVPLVAALLARPSTYERVPAPRPLLKAYRHLQPYENFFHEPNQLLVSREFGFELSRYAGKCTCPWTQFGELRAKVTPQRTLAQVFDQAGATLFLADELILSDPLAQQFLADAKLFHWDVLEERHIGQEKWAVLHRTLPVR
jgi:hypothetical protein